MISNECFPVFSNVIQVGHRDPLPQESGRDFFSTLPAECYEIIAHMAREKYGWSTINAIASTSRSIHEKCRLVKGTFPLVVVVRDWTKLQSIPKAMAHYQIEKMHLLFKIRISWERMHFFLRSDQIRALKMRDREETRSLISLVDVDRAGQHKYYQLSKIVRGEGEALQDFSPEMINANIVATAVNNRGLSLRHAPLEYRKNQEIVRIACKRDFRALKFAHRALRSDPHFVVSLLERNAHILRYAHRTLRSDRNIVLLAVKIDGMTIGYASPSLQQDLELIRIAVKQNPLAFSFVPIHLRDPRLISPEAREIIRDIIEIPYSLYPEVIPRRKPLFCCFG